MSPEEIEVVDKAIKNDAVGMYGTYGRTKILSLLSITADEVSIFVNNGFFDFMAIPVSVGESGLYRYYTLNARWRQLKWCGSYQAFVAWEKQDIEEQEQRKEDEELYLKYQAENAMWQSTLNPLIKKANASTIVTNRYIRIANRNLIIIFAVTAVISCGSFVVSTISLFRNSRIERLYKQQLDQKDSVINTHKINAGGRQDGAGEQ